MGMEARERASSRAVVPPFLPPCRARGGGERSQWREERARFAETTDRLPRSPAESRNKPSQISSTRLAAWHEFIASQHPASSVLENVIVFLKWRGFS